MSHNRKAARGSIVAHHIAGHIIAGATRCLLGIGLFALHIGKGVHPSHRAPLRSAVVVGCPHLEGQLGSRTLSNGYVHLGHADHLVQRQDILAVSHRDAHHK